MCPIVRSVDNGRYVIVVLVLRGGQLVVVGHPLICELNKALLDTDAHGVVWIVLVVVLESV